MYGSGKESEKKGERALVSEWASEGNTIYVFITNIQDIHFRGTFQLFMSVLAMVAHHQSATQL